MKEEQFAALRQHMVLEIATHTALLGERIGKYTLDPRVMEAMGKVPRHLHVPVELQPYAYLNRPLPIGYDKTIVAEMMPPDETLLARTSQAMDKILAM